MKDVINDIIDYAHMEINNIQLYFKDFYIKELLENCYEVHSTVAKLKKLQYKFEYDDTIPSIIHSDPDKISQVMRNLLFNALKYTETGSVTIKIESTSDFDVKVIIEDTGCGIS